MRKPPLVLIALNGLVWGGLSWIGWGAVKSIHAQHVAGYPSAGQIGGYLVFPLLMLTVSTVPGALVSQTHWGSAVTITWCYLTLFVALLYFMALGGGV
jgi:hypothetical protein